MEKLIQELEALVSECMRREQTILAVKVESIIRSAKHPPSDTVEVIANITGQGFTIKFKSPMPSIITGFPVKEMWLSWEKIEQILRNIKIDNRPAPAAQGHGEGDLVDALIWTSGSSDFQHGGKARKGWLKICKPLIDKWVKGHNSHNSDDKETPVPPTPAAQGHGESLREAMELMGDLMATLELHDPNNTLLEKADSMLTKFYSRHPIPSTEGKCSYTEKDCPYFYTDSSTDGRGLWSEINEIIRDNKYDNDERILAICGLLPCYRPGRQPRPDSEMATELRELCELNPTNIDAFVSVYEIKRIVDRFYKQEGK